MSDDNVKRSQKAWRYVDRDGVPKQGGQVGTSQLGRVSENVCEWRGTTRELCREDDPSTASPSLPYGGRHESVHTSLHS